MRKTTDKKWWMLSKEEGHFCITSKIIYYLDLYNNALKDQAMEIMMEWQDDYEAAQYTYS